MEKKVVWPPALIYSNSRTIYSEPWRGCFTSVLQHVVMGFNIDNTLLLMKCSKQDMLKSMMLLLVDVSLVLMKCNKEDMLEGLALLLVGVSLLLKKCSKKDMLEGMVFLLMGVAMLLLKCNKDVMLEGEVVAPIVTTTNHHKACV